MSDWPAGRERQQAAGNKGGVPCAAAATRRRELDRTDWLLLFLTVPARRGARPRSLEPLRIMKGLFLISQRGAGELHDLYAFKPYDYGPFTPEVYRDLDALAEAGLVVEDAVAGRSWRTYRPSEEGIAAADLLAGFIDETSAAILAEAYEFVTSRGFLRLLRDIYAQYPGYAVNTIVKDAAPRP